ncbi:hypothetical protein ACHAL6_04020 [Proteiniclasticum sp. C24MP]|uniref:hypothetical protein n=1 Tax=Proteiniclasticum sp. C24MP TaxID=3374101 RepID=UPI0037547FF2
MELKLYELIVKSAKVGLELQLENGSFPKGTNGPWKDSDTHVRTTAHWAMLLYKAYKITDEQEYLLAARKSCNYLIQKENRPYGNTFYCRSNDDKDKCNGLIGQAWALEPLIIIGIEENNSTYINTAKEVIENIPYNKKMNLWETIDIDGANHGCHFTINQQIWFSAMNLLLANYLENDNLIENSKSFYSNLPNYIQWVDDNNLIRHRVILESPVKSFVKKILLKRSNENFNTEVRLRSKGYQTFILFGLALAYNYFPQYDFWQDPRMMKMIKKSFNYVLSKYPYGYLEADDGFRWSYNPVGIEMSYASEAFSEYLEIDNHHYEIEKWISLQIYGYYNFDDDLMNLNTTDSNILSSRLYEATYISDCIIKPYEWHTNWVNKNVT